MVRMISLCVCGCVCETHSEEVLHSSVGVVETGP